MSMIKTIPAGSYDYEQSSPVKVAMAGLRGNDFKAFIKRAGHELAEWVRANPPKNGETYVHSIALGCTEKAGPNRNADGYPEAMLKVAHPTFEKYGRLYYNHVNQNPAKSYGVVKRSWYNEPVGRVELIIAANGTKEAAERNGGLVAEKFLDKLANDEDIPISQSVRIENDECVACGNKARTRREYCDEHKCVKYGGCKKNLGRTFDDGFTMFVQNPNKTNKFFDASDVGDTRGADRTAFVTGKVANNGLIVGGAELAEMLGLKSPVYLHSAETLKAREELTKVAALQEKMKDVIEYVPWSVLTEGKTIPLPHKQATDQERSQFLADTAQIGIVLPPHLWLAVCTGTDSSKCAEFIGDRILSPHKLLNREDALDFIAEAALPDSDLVSAVKLANYVPTVKNFEKIAALSSFTRFDKASIVGLQGDVGDEVEARYLAYQANALARQTDRSKLVLMSNDAVRHNLTQPGCPTAN